MYISIWDRRQSSCCLSPCILFPFFNPYCHQSLFSFVTFLSNHNNMVFGFLTPLEIGILHIATTRTLLTPKWILHENGCFSYKKITFPKVLLLFRLPGVNLEIHICTLWTLQKLMHTFPCLEKSIAKRSLWTNFKRLEMCFFTRLLFFSPPFGVWLRYWIWHVAGVCSLTTQLHGGLFIIGDIQIRSCIQGHTFFILGITLVTASVKQSSLLRNFSFWWQS